MTTEILTPAPPTLDTEVLMAGFGGQGTLLAGKVLAQACLDLGYEVSWLPSYGPEMRGGTANVIVRIASTPIGSPLVDRPRSLVVMNLPSLEKFAPKVRAGGVIVVNGDGCMLMNLGSLVTLAQNPANLYLIVLDNGLYGLTKGQFSPTADQGSKAKNGVVNDLPPLDLCALAIELGATFVARSFSGDKKQLLAILKAAMSHKGTCLIDVISPCVTFNDHEGSTKSYAYVKDHDEPVGEVSFIPFFEDISVDYEPGSAQEVTMHDGSVIYFKQVPKGYDPTDRASVMRFLDEHRASKQIVTGLLYVDPNSSDLHDLRKTSETPLRELPYETLCPGNEALQALQEEYR